MLTILTKCDCQIRKKKNQTLQHLWSLHSKPFSLRLRLWAEWYSLLKMTCAVFFSQKFFALLEWLWTFQIWYFPGEWRCRVAMWLSLMKKLLGWSLMQRRLLQCLIKKRIVLIRFGLWHFMELTAFDPKKEGFSINFDKQFIEIYAFFSFHV